MIFTGGEPEALGRKSCPIASLSAPVPHMDWPGSYLFYKETAYSIACAKAVKMNFVSRITV
jgi:hypothetical protein